MALKACATSGTERTRNGWARRWVLCCWRTRATARIVIEEVFLRGDYSCPFLSLNYLS